jgi:hypothetical protein
MLTPGSKYHYLVNGMVKLKPGEAFQAEQYVDFTCTPESFRNVLYQAASTAGHGWHVSAVVIGKIVLWACWKQSDYLRPNLPAYPLVKKLRG